MPFQTLSFWPIFMSLILNILLRIYFFNQILLSVCYYPWKSDSYLFVLLNIITRSIKRPRSKRKMFETTLHSDFSPAEASVHCSMSAELTVAKWANVFNILRAHAKAMVANASGRAKSFTPVVLLRRRWPVGAHGAIVFSVSWQHNNVHKLLARATNWRGLCNPRQRLYHMLYKPYTCQYRSDGLYMHFFYNRGVTTSCTSSGVTTNNDPRRIMTGGHYST